MRNPIRNETDAFRLAVGGAGLTAASLAIGAAGGPLAGGALFLGALIGTYVWEISTDDPDRRRPLREAAAEGRRIASPSRRRVLVVANRTLQGDELAETLRRRGAHDSELRVVAPIVVSRMHYLHPTSTGSSRRHTSASRPRSIGRGTRAFTRAARSAIRTSRSARSKTSCAASQPTRC